jgi:hypothetical protein
VGARETVFGEVADLYQDVRPGYGDELVSAVLAYAGDPAWAVEVGAGTGLGTDAFVARGVAVHCVESDARMAGVLRRRFAGVTRVSVEVARFEEWQPPAGGVRLLFCAQAWHWMDPVRRCGLAFEALGPGGVVALFGHQYRFADAVMRNAVTGVYAAHAPELLLPDEPEASPEEHWLTVELAGSGLFTDVRAHQFDRTVTYSTDRYLRLVETFSPFRRRLPVDRRPGVLAALAAALDARGGVVRLRLDTVLALARRPASAAA